jgi:hypothetical protein
LEAVWVGIIGPPIIFFVYHLITKQYGRDKLVAFVFACIGGLFIVGAGSQIVGEFRANNDPKSIRTLVGPLWHSGRTVQSSSEIRIAEKSFFADGLYYSTRESQQAYFPVPEYISKTGIQPRSMAAVTYSDRFKFLNGRPFVMRLYMCEQRG